MTPVLLAAAVTVVRVLGAGGAPEPGAQVICGGDVAGAVLSDAAGKARAPAACDAALCVKGDLAGVMDPRTHACALKPASLVTVAPVPPGCAPPQGCRASLTPSRPGPSRPGTSRAAPVVAPLVALAASAGEARWRFPALPPGPYLVSVVRTSDGWTCAGPAEVRPGRAALALAWREPRPLHGRVIGAADGAPRAGVTVAAAARAREETGPGAGASWVCGPVTPTVVSDAQGHIRVLVDPSRVAVLAAGGVTVERDGAATEETVYLELP